MKRPKLLVDAIVPDGKETYMSPIVSKMHEDDEDLTIIFGTGGETIGGNLYRTMLGNLMNGDNSNAVILASGEKKGFIAPPVLADITRNGYLDIVANAVEGRTVAINGKTNALLWETKIENVEAYASPGVGYFNNDSIPDFFSIYGEGVFPELTRSIQVMHGGKTGEIQFMDSLGFAQTASPVIADFNNDGFDNALVSINFTMTDLESRLINAWHNMLVVYDFRNNSTYQLTGYLPGINLASTPWIGDLDGNGKMDIVFCILPNASMNGFRIIRMPTNINLTSGLRWGAYMGSNYDGIFR